MGSVTDAPIYIDLGGALAAFGLIFAAYQLRKPKWDIALQIKSIWKRNLLWILGGAGSLLTLVGILVSEFPTRYLPYFFGSPLFYGVAAYIFFIAAPLSWVYFSTQTRGLFTKKTSRKFYEVLVQAVSRTDENDANAVLEVLLPNFEDICKAAREHKKDDEMGQSARSILEVILSTTAIVKILTTKRLDALLYIFAVVEEHGIGTRELGIGMPKIVQNLFYDKESFFYKQLDRDGLALSSNIYESLFHSPVLLTNFDLFGHQTLTYSMSGKMDLSSVKVFIETLSRSIATYLTTGRVPPRHINNGLSHLSEIFGNICLKIGIEEERGIEVQPLNDDWWSLQAIVQFLGYDYSFLADKEPLNQRIIETEKTTSEASFFSDSTINAGIAAALYKAFSQLSRIKNTTDTFDVYHFAFRLLHGMMYTSEYKRGYREPFTKRMWEQIAANMIHRHYPVVLRTYLEFIGFCLTSDSGERKGWIGEETEKMRALLYIDLKPLIDSGTLMVNKEKMRDVLLPKSMDYKNGKFIYKISHGEEKEITPPPEGTNSALEGIDLEKFQSLI